MKSKIMRHLTHAQARDHLLRLAAMAGGGLYSNSDVLDGGAGDVMAIRMRWREGANDSDDKPLLERSAA